jgi:hypothetical protein
MNILFATTLIPTADRSGGELASLAMIEALRQLGHRTTVAGYLRPGKTAACNNTAIVIANRPIETAASGLRALLWVAESAFRHLPYTSAKFFSRRYASIVREMCARQQVDAVVVDHTQMYWLREHVPDHIPVVLVMHNAESDLYERGASLGTSTVRQFLYRREARMLREVEKQAAATVDRIWVLSAADADRIGRNESPVSVLPLIPEWREGADRVDPTFDVALMGTWSWEPNADALRWFMSEVYPRLPQSTSVRVAGAGAEWLRGQNPHVTYCGFVQDAPAFLRAARVIAVPTRYGSGVETKMFASIGSGRPVIATSTATRGLDGLPDSVVVANEAAQFAYAITTHLGARRQQAAHEQAEAWWRGRRRAFVSVIDTDMSRLAPNAARARAGTAHEIGNTADGFA